MTDHEAKAFMAVEGYEQSLKMRSYDEAAKRINLPKPMMMKLQRRYSRVLMATERGR
jgi:methylmalonyl-CoA mutase N-terminal domain/subunit